MSDVLGPCAECGHVWNARIHSARAVVSGVGHGFRRESERQRQARARERADRERSAELLDRFGNDGE